MHCNVVSVMHCNAGWAEGGGIDQAWARSTLAARHHQLALNYFSAPPAGCKIISRKMQLVQDYLKSTTGALVQATIASPLVPPNHQSVLKGDWIFNIHRKVQLHHHQNNQIQLLTPLSPISPTIGRWSCWWPSDQAPSMRPDRAPGSCIFACVFCVFWHVCGSIQQGLCLCVCVWRRGSSEYAIL